MVDDIYAEYGPYFYLPMTQAASLAVPVTIGCSWDRCLYCDLNHDNRFRTLQPDEIEAKLKALQIRHARTGRPVRRAVLAGGNPFCLATPKLIEIARLISRYFPQVENISSFARADDILRKSREELLELKKWGMGEISVGIESGNDEVLAFHDKGVTRAENLRAMQSLEDCGMACSAYIMLGLGGKKMSRAHALDTASLLSLADPQVITVVTLVLFKDARLVEKVRSRAFIRLNARESIQEEQILLENLNMRNTLFNATHKTNALILKGRLPAHKSLLLDRIRRTLEETDPSSFNKKERAKWKTFGLE